MGPDVGRVDGHPPDLAESRVGRHRLEQPPQAARGDPAAEPVGHGAPRPELGGQVAELDAGVGQI